MKTLINNRKFLLIVLSIFLLNACDKKKNQKEIIIEKLIEIPKTLDLNGMSSFVGTLLSE